MSSNYQTTDLELKPKPNFFYGYSIVTCCYITSMVVWGTWNSFGVFFDSLLAEFNWSRAVTSGAFSLCTIISGLAAIPFGRVTDKIGPRAVMTACSLILGTGYILMALIDSVWQFYLVYGILIGIGTSGFWVPVLATVSRWFSKKRGLMVGIVLTGSGAGTLVFPPIANWLISVYQWRLSIAVVGAATLICGTIISQFIKRDPSTVQQVADGETPGKSSQHEAGGAAHSLKEAVRTPQFWMALGVFFGCGFYAYTIMVHIIPRAVLLGVSPSVAASLLAVIGGISILGGLATGALADRMGIKKTLITFLAIAAAAIIWLLGSRETWQLYLFSALIGLAYGSIGVSETIATIWLFGLKENALILALVDLALTAGAAAGPLVAGYVFDITQSYQGAFILTAVICLASLLISVFVKPPQPP